VTVKNSYQFFKHSLKLNVTKCCCYFQREPLYKRRTIIIYNKTMSSFSQGCQTFLVISIKWGIPTDCIIWTKYRTRSINRTLTPTHSTVTCRVMVSLILVSVVALFKSAIKGSILIQSNNRRCAFPEKENNV